MNIVLHCGGMPFNGETINNSSLGGSESAAYYVAKELVRLGNSVTLFTAHKEEGNFDGVTYCCAGDITDEAPLGERFHFYAVRTPSDVLIIQRHPYAFAFPWASKMNILWLHDLALYRSKPIISSSMWNVDVVLAVSEFHKKQICAVYGFHERIVKVAPNGVDLRLYENEIETLLRSKNGVSESDAVTVKEVGREKNKFNIIYSSRPERGLENLVRPGGIMERLGKIDNKFHLYVCGYDNTTEQMSGLYNALWAQCEKLTNVTNLGAIRKQRLADVQRQCDLWVYPTEFEEVSCITAMESMAAGLPGLTSRVAALPETCVGPGIALLNLKNNSVDIDKFTRAIVELSEGSCATRSVQQKQTSKMFTWENSVKILLNHLEKQFVKNASNPVAVAKHLLQTSDIYAARAHASGLNEGLGNNAIYRSIAEETELCYNFIAEDDWAEHYKKYYAYEKQKGVVYGPEDLSRDSRFNVVANFIKELPDGISILDYGCAHGHYTCNLAKSNPKKKFVGVDIDESNIEAARKWANDESIGNVKFYRGQVDGLGVRVFKGGKNTSLNSGFDAAIVAEILEHVKSPKNLVRGIRQHLKHGAKIITTTPFGPWEAIGYEKEWPWRAHVHHFERDDLQNMFGGMENFSVVAVSSGSDKKLNALGSYVCFFDNCDLDKIGEIDYSRKFKLLPSKQTLSLCMIVKDSEQSLRKTLDSVKSAVDEIIIGIDETTADRTEKIIAEFISDTNIRPCVTTFKIPSPLKIGFAAARNLTVKKAVGDWVLWIDSDEELFGAANIGKYLRSNQFNGYAIAQHHFAVQPAGLIKTDFPCRIFRNKKGIHFFGVVHEHPETAVNEGVGHVQNMSDVSIAHYGYGDEAIRRARFTRNIGLMTRDREQNPTRNLGKFLWIRDLAQMCRYDLELNGGHVTSAMLERVEEGKKLWNELLKDNQIKMLTDGVEYYSNLIKLSGEGFDFKFKAGASKLNGGVDLSAESEVTGRFESVEVAKEFLNKIVDTKVETYESKYF